MTGTELNRRRLLTGLGTVGLGTIAGCGGGDTSTPSPTTSPTPSPSPTPTTPNEQAITHYESAIETLVQTKETLDEWAGSSFEGSRVSSLQSQVSSARDELDEAEAAADPSGDLVVQIEQARLVADFQELSLAYYESVTVFLEVLSEGSALGDNELHQRAAETYAEAQDVLEDARRVIDDMGTVLEQIDTDTLDEPALEYTGEPLDHLDLQNLNAIDGAESYAVGYENVHLAFVQLEAGQEEYENEAFAAAREAWETGRERARESRTAFEAVIDNDHMPQNFRQDSIQLLGAVETIIEAFDKFVEGAQAAEDGNHEEANTLVGEGFDLLGQL